MYSFQPSDDQKTLLDGVRRFATRELRPQMRPADESGALPSSITRSGWELGLLPGSLPEEFGGFGERSVLTGALAAEELAWGDLAGALALLAPNLVAVPVLLAGSASQRKELLPAFAGESYRPASAALMEPRHDFDAGALETTAVRRDGEYRLSGVKCNVPFAVESEWVLVYARLDGATQAFLVKRGTPGLVIGERERNMGLHALPLYAVELRDCVIPAGQRLGGDGGADVS